MLNFRQSVQGFVSALSCVVYFHNAVFIYIRSNVTCGMITFDNSFISYMISYNKLYKEIFFFFYQKSNFRLNFLVFSLIILWYRIRIGTVSPIDQNGRQSFRMTLFGYIHIIYIYISHNIMGRHLRGILYHEQMK